MSTPGITVGYDVTGQNYASVPRNAQLALYVTGSNGVPATAQQLAENPDCVRIAQSPFLQADEAPHADALDVEFQAATMSDVGPWTHDAINCFDAVTRPGQREPIIYASSNNITNVANELVAAHLDNGRVGLWIAHWGVPTPEAIAAILQAAGPFPIHAWQILNLGDYDMDLFSTAWLNKRSTKTPTEWTYGPPRSLIVKPGRHDFHAMWAPPENALVPPAFYAVYAYQSGKLVPTYPRIEFGTETQPDPGSLHPSTTYEIRVAAHDAQGLHVKPGVYASAVLTTAHALL